MRNKSVAHNTNNTGMQWSDFVGTMNFIIRVWGIIDEFYSPNCSPRAIQLADQLYAPLRPHFTSLQIKEMKDARLKIMRDLFAAASTNLVTGDKDTIKPFWDLKVVVNIESVTDAGG